MVIDNKPASETLSDFCSIGEEEAIERRGVLADVLEDTLIQRVRTDDSIILTLRRDEGTEVAVRALAESEAQCCPGYEFDIRPDGEYLEWVVTLNDRGTAAMLDALWKMLGGEMPEPPGTAIVAEPDAACCADCASGFVRTRRVGFDGPWLDSRRNSGVSVAERRSWRVCSGGGVSGSTHSGRCTQRYRSHARRHRRCCWSRCDRDRGSLGTMGRSEELGPHVKETNEAAYG